MNEIIIFFFSVLIVTVNGLASVEQTSSEPITVIPGEDALIECIVKDADNYTVLWKYANSQTDIETAKTLTANKIRLTEDDRISVLHRTGHDTWVLKISKSKSEDSGVYICEINSIPALRVTRFVSIGYPEAGNPWSLATPHVQNADHNFTDCCVKEHVSKVCHNYCNIKNLVSMKMTAHVAITCFGNMKSMVKCLSDGRNHMPCCKRQNVPNACLPTCIGEYTLSTIYEHVTCLQYSAPVLSCIAEGVESLPPPPEDITAEPLSQTEIKILWKLPKNIKLIDHYLLNVSELLTIDEMENTRKIVDTKVTTKELMKKSIKISANRTEYFLKDLKPQTMYEIVMISVNKIGRSVATNVLRVLPLSSTAAKERKDKVKETTIAQKVPNLRQCCKEGGIKSEKCLSILCDLKEPADSRNLDLISCVPYANISFNCLSADNVDKTDCCRERGITPFCQSLCKPIASVDFRHSICFHHFNQFMSCYLESYGVIPSEPQDVYVSNIHESWALLKWTPPSHLANGVTKYSIHFKFADADDLEYAIKDYATHSPFLLDNLKPGRRYEVYVSAINSHGSSRGSIRVTFETLELVSSDLIDVIKDSPKGVYNETACCERASLPHDCLPLCNVHVKISDAMNLGPICVDTNTANTMIRCAVGGRDHRPCCKRRGVTPECLGLCTGLIEGSPMHIGAKCGQYASSIMICIKEGVGVLPGMPVDLHTTKISNTSIHLQWRKAKEDEMSNDTTYSFQVRYEEIMSEVPFHPLKFTRVVNTTKESVVIENLIPSTIYSIHVVSVNQYGSSLPSLVIVAHTTDLDTKTVNLSAKVGPPHNVEIVHQTYDSISLKWLPPLYINADANINYRVFYRPFASETWQTLDTFYTNIDIRGLKPNTDYAIKVQATGDNALESHFSEIILVFTDPLEAASIDKPVITPKGVILEGSNITIECTGRGAPKPTISVLVNGKILRKTQTTRLVFNLTNVDRNLRQIACYALNGVKNNGNRYSQESIEVRVRAKPSIKAVQEKVQFKRFDKMTLTCIVSGDPAPKVSWYRDITADIEILPSSNVEMITYRDKTKMESFNSTLVYNRVTEAEDGQFKCKADNEYGTDSAFIDVDIVSMRKEYSNITECCIEQGVDSDCLKACSKDENDIDFILNKPNCLTKINKIVSCAFDGKDNRQCCRRKQVPDECIHWCFGIENELEFCLLGSVKQIISCFTNETSVDSNRVNNNLNEHAVKRRVARMKSHKNYVLAVVLFTTVLALISIAVIAAMIYYNKKYMRRTTNNNNEDVIGFENQTYLKDTDSVNLRTQSSTTQQSNQNTTSTA